MVDTALSGRSALSKIQASPPDLILLDIMMPDMGGLEVTKSIRQNQNLPFIPIVLVTACEEVSKDQGFKVGANGFIRKPIDFNKLLTKISDLLQKE